MHTYNAWRTVAPGARDAPSCSTSNQTKGYSQSPRDLHTTQQQTTSRDSLNRPRFWIRSAATSFKIQITSIGIQTWTWQITSVSAVWNVRWVNWCLVVVVYPWLWKATQGGITTNTVRTQWPSVSAISCLLLVRRPLWDWCRWCTFCLCLLQCNSGMNEWYYTLWVCPQ